MFAGIMWSMSSFKWSTAKRCFFCLHLWKYCELSHAHITSPFCFILLLYWRTFKILLSKQYLNFNSISHPISIFEFQIAILNSPTQFLFLTLSFPLVISLSIVWRVCVFMVVWPWVLVLLFLWICGHVCM